MQNRWYSHPPNYAGISDPFGGGGFYGNIAPYNDPFTLTFTSAGGGNTGIPLPGSGSIPGLGGGGYGGSVAGEAAVPLPNTLLGPGATPLSAGGGGGWVSDILGAAGAGGGGVGSWWSSLSPLSQSAVAQGGLMGLGALFGGSEPSGGGGTIPSQLQPFLDLLSGLSSSAGARAYLGEPFAQQGPGIASGMQAALLASLIPAITGSTDISGFMPQQNTPLALSLLYPPEGYNWGPSKTFSGRVEPRALGGPTTRGGTYLVGEQGPELLRTSGQGMVLPLQYPGAGGGSLTPPAMGAWNNALGSKGGTSAPPLGGGAVPGTRNLAPRPNAPHPLGIAQPGTAPPASGATSSAIPAMAAPAQANTTVPSLFQSSLNAAQTGMGTGFLPTDLSMIEGYLNPAMERAWDQGAAALREQAALTGNLSSSGATSALTDYRAQLENAKLAQLAGIYGGALPTAISSQTALTGQGMNFPGNVLSWLGQPINTGVQQSQFQQNLPLSLASGGTTGAFNMPIQAQTYSPSKGQQLLGAGSTIGAGYLAGK